VMDQTGVADVRFALPTMGKPITRARVLGAVVRRGNLVTVNGVKVAGMVPWAGIVIMGLFVLALAWITLLAHLTWEGLSASEEEGGKGSPGGRDPL